MPRSPRASHPVSPPPRESKGLSSATGFENTPRGVAQRIAIETVQRAAAKRTTGAAGAVIQRVPLTDVHQFIQWMESNGTFRQYASLDRADAAGRCAESAAAITGALNDEGYAVVYTVMVSAQRRADREYMNHFATVVVVGGVELVVDGTMQQFRTRPAAEAGPGVYARRDWEQRIATLAALEGFVVRFQRVSGGVVRFSMADERRHFA
jgi:hypothetical protein